MCNLQKGVKLLIKFAKCKFQIKYVNRQRVCDYILHPYIYI